MNQFSVLGHNNQIENKNWSKTAMLEYKGDMGSDSNLMSVRIFKTIFPRCTSADLNKSVKKD